MEDRNQIALKVIADWMYKTTKRGAVAVAIVRSCESCSLPSNQGVSDSGAKRMSMRERAPFTRQAQR